MIRKLLLGLLVVALIPLGLSLAYSRANAASFSDVPSDYWAANAIADLASRSIIGGYPDGSFKPENPVTRAEFSKMILLTMGFAQETPLSATFVDESSNDWAYGYVEGAVKHGLVKGYPDGTFQPNGNITMAEILTVLVRAQGWTLANPPDGVTILVRQNGADREMTASDWFYQNVGTAAGQGLIQFPDHPQINTAVGASGFAMALNDPATRAQTAFFLDRMLTNATPSPSPTPSTAGVSLTLVAKGMAFNQSSMTVPAGADITLTFDNQDSGVPHNFALYMDSSASTSLFVGEVITGPKTIEYHFKAPTQPGTYFFRCDVHPTSMTGQFIVQ